MTRIKKVLGWLGIALAAPIVAFVFGPVYLIAKGMEWLYGEDW